MHGTSRIKIGLDSMLSYMQALRKRLFASGTTNGHIGMKRFQYSKSLLCLEHWTVDKPTRPVIISAILYGQKIYRTE